MCNKSLRRLTHVFKAPAPANFRITCFNDPLPTFTICFQEILPGISAVSEKKKKAIIDLVTTKNRLESHMSLVGKDITKLQNSIEDFAKATEANKIKYEEGTRERSNIDYKEKYKTR